MNELSTTLAAQINQAHADCVECDDDITEVILRKCNKARECGILLSGYKKDCAHGQWSGLFSGSKLNSAIQFEFTQQTGLGYMRFATANPEPLTTLADGVRSLWDAMIACGAIAKPVGHGEQQRTGLTWLDRCCNSISKVRELTNGQLEKRGGDISVLTDGERGALKTSLKPMVDLYALL